MKQFIGIKIVQAEPAWQVFNEHGEPGEVVVQDRDLELTTVKTALNGYKVVYESGYESWYPKEVFEKHYRRMDGLNFGLALEAVKVGKKIARAGWNGKGQYVELADCIGYKNAAGQVINPNHHAIGNKCLAFVGTSGVQLGWLASQADMLADDWRIVE